jgi:beta-glucosidase
MKALAAAICLPLLAASSLLRAAEPFHDPKLPLEQRVNNLVSLLTLDEKIAMLGQPAPAIPFSPLLAPLFAHGPEVT